jgi:hypothetical protein
MRGVIAAILGAQFPRDVDLRPGDMRVHVDTAGHDGEAGEIEDTVRFGMRRSFDEAAVANP